MVDGGGGGGGGLLLISTLVCLFMSSFAGPVLNPITLDQFAHDVDKRIDNLGKNEFNNVFLEKRPHADRDNPFRTNLVSPIGPWGHFVGGRSRRDTEKLPVWDERPASRDNIPEKHGGGRSITQPFILHVNLNGPANATMLEDLKIGLATAVGLSLDQVHLRGDPDKGTLNFYFTDPSRHNDLIPAHDVTTRLSTAGLNAHLPNWMRAKVTPTEIFVQPSSVHHDFWSWPYLPYVFGGAGVLLLIIILLLVISCIQRRRKSLSLSTTPESTLNSTPQRQVCLIPTLKPDVINNTSTIQPDIPFHYLDKGSMTPVQTPAMKVRTKGLLERRGSNASLTLELNPSAPGTPAWGSPPRECSTEEFLMSAGNRLSRKQLRNSLKNTKALYEEFWEIPMNHPDKVEIPGSGTKNRYRTIIPNEFTRVVLPDIDGDLLSTYINANYIRGYAGEPQAYIATQGVMTHTVIDFWRMVWHEQAPIVVMITKLMEKQKIKCESYLPKSHETYGDITVTVRSISEKHGYNLRHLTIKYLDEEREVLHYWYTAWPDHKAPDVAKQMLELSKEVEIVRFHPETGAPIGPVIVHCSAGIGRTGCFIATSIGMRQLTEEHNVDVLGIVCGMRLDRGGMIQTNEQYEFVHRALCLFEKELPEHPPSGL